MLIFVSKPKSLPLENEYKQLSTFKSTVLFGWAFQVLFVLPLSKMSLHMFMKFKAPG